MQQDILPNGVYVSQVESAGFENIERVGAGISLKPNVLTYTDLIYEVVPSNVLHNQFAHHRHRGMQPASRDHHCLSALSLFYSG